MQQLVYLYNNIHKQRFVGCVAHRNSNAFHFVYRINKFIYVAAAANAAAAAAVVDVVVVIVN